MFNWGAALGEGIMASLFLGLISKKRPELRVPYFAIFVLVEIAVVVLRYSGQENSAFFFWHPYLAFLISNISDYAVYRRGCGEARAIAFEKTVLWPFIVIPVLSALVLTVGWLIKLYGRYLF
ncbi:hypothetical protein SAMN06296386_108156 [Lachnospiraceae bacterium]|nr:hypothetical protein SAMN06296386_108156 [Lachnospiraceae bacterium]